MVSRALTHLPEVLSLARDTPDAIKASSGAQTIITVRYDADAAPAVDALHRIRGGLHTLDVDGPTTRVRTPRPDGVLGHLVRAGAASGLTVHDPVTTPPVCRPPSSPSPNGTTSAFAYVSCSPWCFARCSHPYSGSCYLALRRFTQRVRTWRRSEIDPMNMVHRGGIWR
jgi:hypothetical protein